MSDYEKILKTAADYISGRSGGFTPSFGIVLGSGLGSLADHIEQSVVIPYSEIPGFPVSTAIGHKGNFICGILEGRRVVAMQGRFHYYEGNDMQRVVIGVRTMKLLGVKYLFLSNAAGGCNPAYNVGDLVVITDHINLMPNPLVGPNLDSFGERFPDMTCVYDKGLRELAAESAKELGIPVKSGVYLASTGPTYETPAEVRFYRSIGADLLGMSTVPEAVAARHCGLKVFGMSVVTNKSNDSSESRVLNDGQDVIRMADRATADMTALFRRIISKIEE
ncbi:MAG: purine-nucleoside phosphorylase [Bacteroidales bacterium]|nr:purine-nucleoside phosphorylase [Bacteroidales bacterium]